MGDVWPGELPMMFKFANALLFAVFTTLIARAMRITKVNVTVLAAVFCTVRLRFTPALLGYRHRW